MPDPNLEERLRDILSCLIQYKRVLINAYTLTSQSPSILNNLSHFLRNRCATLTQYMVSRIKPENPDKDLSKCIDCLEKALDPWDLDLSILAPHLCEMILVNSELNISDEMISKIIKEYLPDPEVDGTPGLQTKEEVRET
jgi:hypothetical protein